MNHTHFVYINGVQCHFAPDFERRTIDWGEHEQCEDCGGDKFELAGDDRHILCASRDCMHAYRIHSAQ